MQAINYFVVNIVKKWWKFEIGKSLGHKRKMNVKSPLNYIGGKYKLLPQILPLFPKRIDVFVDLFCGGLNVGVNINANKVICNDNLVYLIDLYRTFQEKAKGEIISYIEGRVSEFGLSLTNQTGYLQLREAYNSQRNPLDLFVLIAFSFNHQIRFNNKHEFNCPFGKDRSCYNIQMKNNLSAFLDSINRKCMEFSSLNFDEFDFSSLGKDDFVYADPPYLITTGSYNDGKRGFTGWNELSERKLLGLLKTLDKREIKFALSNVLHHKGKSNLLLISWIEENGFYVNYLNKDYSNCNYHTIDKGKGASVEVLVTNYIPENRELTLWP